MSGIYIPGMEMPKEHEHPIHLAIFPCGTIEYDRVSDGLGWRICKAVPVPDHGRLGDLDAMEAKDNADYEQAMQCNLAFVTKTAIMKTHDCVQQAIAETETVIPADPGKEASP